MPALVLESARHLQTLEANKEKPIVVLSFWAPWAEPSVKLNEIFDQLADMSPNLAFAKVEAENLSDVTEKFEVSAVPTFLFLQNGGVIHKIEGANGPQLADQVSYYSKSLGGAATSAPVEDLNTRLEKLVNYAPVMLFMKGNPSQPQCGFSNKLVQLLQQNEINFDSFNILSDETVRQGLKTYSNWPTFPQLYVNGKLIGGLDIVKELAEEGELLSVIPEAAKGKKPVAATTTTTAQPASSTSSSSNNTLNDRIETLLKSSPVLLFMKGSPDEPRCGFSSKIVNILRENNVQFNHFNILADEEIRQGLKTYSNWPTYPQLYSKAKLVGGLDIVKELAEEGALLEALE